MEHRPCGRAWRLSALLLALALLLSGCWSRRELNELAVVVAMGVDLHRSGYKVTAQIVNFKEASKNTSSDVMSVVTYQAIGESVPEALQRMLGEVPRQLYLSHLRVMVFGEALARRGLTEVLDFVARNHQFRTDFPMLVAHRSEASDVLKVVTPIDNIPANSLFSSILVSSKKWAATGRVTLQQFVARLDLEGSDPVLSGVEVIGDKTKGTTDAIWHTLKPNTLLRHSGLAVFKRDKLVGWLEEQGSKTVNYLLNDVSTTNTTFKCPDDEKRTISMQLQRVESEIEVVLRGEELTGFNVRVRAEANLDSVQCPIDMGKPDSIPAIERKLEERIVQVFDRHVGKVQKQFNVDIFGLGEVLHRRHPKIWKKYKRDWDEHFKETPVTVQANVKLRRVGSIVQPLKKDMVTR
ncbi:Ger(x)C family spore germination protein [Cohnella cellulosilytica]|uniref:Ger(X)C family spore germination protein n=1 Tax=Cohnella cellulosilytica TaxID=986710 RepID=A0ABW2FDB0_9BACL